MKVNYIGTSTHYYGDIRQISTKQLLNGHEARTNKTLTTGT